MKLVLYFLFLCLSYDFAYVSGFYSSLTSPRALAKGCFRLSPLRETRDKEADGVPLVQFGSKKYYEGLVKEPISSDNSQKVDNLTPNLKFIGICAGIIGGLLFTFYLANKDLPPPSF